MIRIYSLRGLLLGHNLAFLLLIVVTGAMGWVGVELRQRAAEESLRLNTLMSLVQETRGDVYRQMTEVFDHHFLGEANAVTDYRRTSARILATFAHMEDVARLAAERTAIDGLKEAYQNVRRRTDQIMSTPSMAVRQADQLAVFFTADLRMVWLDDYELLFALNDELLTVAQEAEKERVDTLSRNAGLVLLIPIGLAAILLLFSRSFVQRAFVRPIGDLLDGFDAFAKGQLDHKVPEHGVTELVTLERAVNRMAQELAQSREALVSAERQAALGALVPVVAHNIRNPLAAIRATAQVHEGPGTPREVVQGLKDIRGTVDRLERWLSALLSYLNPLRLARVEVRLSEIFDQAVMFLAPRLEAKQIRLRRVGWDVAAVASLDVHLMEQAVYGLLSNAVEASPENAPITLTVRLAGPNVQMVIADRGPGMPFRPMPGDLHPGPTTKSYGSGLGIPFAFKICGLHQGMLEFSAREGGGTEVIVTLPAAQSAQSTVAWSA